MHQALPENDIHSGLEEEGRDHLGERGSRESGGQDLFGCCYGSKCRHRDTKNMVTYTCKKSECESREGEEMVHKLCVQEYFRDSKVNTGNTWKDWTEMLFDDFGSCVCLRCHAAVLGQGEEQDFPDSSVRQDCKERRVDSSLYMYA